MKITETELYLLALGLMMNGALGTILISMLGVPIHGEASGIALVLTTSIFVFALVFDIWELKNIADNLDQ